jgi:anti-anti-sigma regulatory factor
MRRPVSGTGCGVRSQVIDALEAQEIKATGNEEGWHRSGKGEQENLSAEVNRWIGSRRSQQLVLRAGRIRPDTTGAARPHECESDNGKSPGSEASLEEFTTGAERHRATIRRCRGRRHVKGNRRREIVFLLTLAYQVADPPVYVLRRKPGTNVFRPQSPEHPDDESFPGLLLLRPEGPIFFANAAQIAHKIEPLVREAQPKVVAVEASGVLDMEYTAVKMFAQLAKRQSQHGVQLWLIGMTPRVLAIIQRSPLGPLLGREGMHFNLEIAVARYLDDAAVRDQP